MPTHTTTLSKSHFYARSFSLICLSLDRRPAGPWLGLHYADIGCFVASKRRQWSHFAAVIEYTFRSSRRRRSTSRDAFTHTSVCIFRRFCMAWNDCVFEAVGFADGHAGVRGATYYRVHDGFWHGE